MAGIKDLARIAAKWARVSAGAQAEYEEGIRNPRKDWAAATAAAEDAYKKGVAQAAAAGRFGKGVKKAGTPKWQAMALQKGPHRWSEGIGFAKDAYSVAFAPFHTALAAIVYPAKGPRGDPRNIDRVAIVAKTLHEKKLALKGGA